MKVNNKAVPFFSALFIILISFAYLMYMHEITHQTIFGYFNVNSTIRMDWSRLGAITEPDTQADISDDDWRIVYSLHAMNEIVSYQYLALFFMMGMTLLIVVLKF